jgi:hypothetical protein
MTEEQKAPSPAPNLEPVAWRFRWVYPSTGEPTAWAETHDPRVARQKLHDGWDVRPLYEDPPSPQTQVVHITDAQVVAAVDAYWGVGLATELSSDAWSVVAGDMRRALEAAIALEANP